jgi:hypothetical protein
MILPGDFAAAVILFIILTLILAALSQKRTTPGEPDTDTTAVIQPGGARLMRQRQLQKQQAQNPRQEVREVVNRLDKHIDSEPDYQRPGDKLAGLPPAFRQQVLNNLGPSVQKYADAALNISNETGLLIEERYKRFFAEFVSARDILVKLPDYGAARKLIFLELIQLRQDLTDLAGDDPFWQQLVDEEINGLIVEILGGFGSKLTQEQLRRLMLEDRRNKHNALKAKSNHASGLPTSDNGASGHSDAPTLPDEEPTLDQITDAFVEDNDAQPAPVHRANGREKRS